MRTLPIYFPGSSARWVKQIMRKPASSSPSSVTRPQSPRLLGHRLQTASRIADSGVQAGTCFMKNKQTQPRARVLVEVEGLSLGYRISAELCSRERSPGSVEYTLQWGWGMKWCSALGPSGTINEIPRALEPCHPEFRFGFFHFLGCVTQSLWTSK